jgi:hypothetical protein
MTTGTITTTRRAILAGAASLSALAIPAAAVAAHDPVFGAIERHRAAFLAYLSAARVSMSTNDDAPEYRARDDATDDAYAAENAAAQMLAATVPTSIAGIVALIAYVDEFNAGGVALPDDPKDWYSTAQNWPLFDEENEIDRFGFAILSNVRRTLEAMAVQS